MKHRGLVNALIDLDVQQNALPTLAPEERTALGLTDADEVTYLGTATPEPKPDLREEPITAAPTVAPAPKVKRFGFSSQTTNRREELQAMARRKEKNRRKHAARRRRGNTVRAYA